MSRKPFGGPTDISEGFASRSHIPMGLLPPSVVSLGFPGAVQRLGSSGVRGVSCLDEGASAVLDRQSIGRCIGWSANFTSQGSGQRVRRPDSLSSVLLTVAFSQSHRSLVSVQHPWVSPVSEESPRLWVGLCYHFTRFHRHARQMLDPLLASEEC